tara:strand:- start:668 stop:883 length:216 start_codon:yes stop_codon:yes gene_type:complete
MSKDCEHPKWSKWSKLQVHDGMVYLERACKKCGWHEYQTINLIQKEAFKKIFSKVIGEIIEEHKKKAKKQI